MGSRSNSATLRYVVGDINSSFLGFGFFFNFLWSNLYCYCQTSTKIRFKYLNYTYSIVQKIAVPFQHVNLKAYQLANITHKQLKDHLYKVVYHLNAV